MDIVPTGVMFANADATTARRNWHCFFFQLADLPEMWLSSNIPEYLAWSFRNAAYNPAAIEPEAVDEYVRVFSLPGTIRSCLEDYREGGAVDSPRDLEDLVAGRKITAPTLVLWGQHGSLGGRGGEWVMDVWREWCTDVRGNPLQIAATICQRNYRRSSSRRCWGSSVRIRRRRPQGLPMA